MLRPAVQHLSNPYCRREPIDATSEWASRDALATAQKLAMLFVAGLCFVRIVVCTAQGWCLEGLMAIVTVVVVFTSMAGSFA